MGKDQYEALHVCGREWLLTRRRTVYPAWGVNKCRYSESQNNRLKTIVALREEEGAVGKYTI